MNKLAGETSAVSGVPIVWLQLKSCNYSPEQQPYGRFDRFWAIGLLSGMYGPPPCRKRKARVAGGDSANGTCLCPGEAYLAAHKENEAAAKFQSGVWPSV